MRIYYCFSKFVLSLSLLLSSAKSILLVTNDISYLSCISVNTHAHTCTHLHTQHPGGNRSNWSLIFADPMEYMSLPPVFPSHPEGAAPTSPTISHIYCTSTHNIYFVFTDILCLGFYLPSLGSWSAS